MLNTRFAGSFCLRFVRYTAWKNSKIICQVSINTKIKGFKKYLRSFARSITFDPIRLLNFYERLLTHSSDLKIFLVWQILRHFYVIFDVKIQEILIFPSFSSYLECNNLFLSLSICLLKRKKWNPYMITFKSTQWSICV